MATVDVEVHTTIDRPAGGRGVLLRSGQRHCVVREYQSGAMGNITAGGSRALGFGSPAASSVGRLEYTYEVVELLPAQRFVMRSDSGPFAMETTYAWEDADDGGTWMMLRNRGEPTAFAGLAAPILATAVRRATGKDLARLKSILEAVEQGFLQSSEGSAPSTCLRTPAC